LIDEATPASRHLLRQLVHYATAVASDDLEPLQAAYASIHRQAEEQFMPTADKLIARGFEKGRHQGQSEGLSQGLSQGLATGRRTALLAVLRARFGSLPEPLLGHIETAELDELDRLLPLAATAGSIDELLG
jgi:flagellar biosynthesis/type III secretory pathway protein FliH